MAVLTGLLKDKVKSISVEDLKKSIEAYIEKVEGKLESRDFSKLVSARLTYREIKELKTFLKPRGKGYGMDIEKYIEGEIS
jgi:hypothetical protein